MNHGRHLARVGRFGLNGLKFHLTVVIRFRNTFDNSRFALDESIGLRIFISAIFNPMSKYSIPNEITNSELRRWVSDMAELCQPDEIYLCDGSEEEYDRLCSEMVESGTFIKLNPEKRPNSFSHVRTRRTLPGSKTGRSFVPEVSLTQARRIIGWLRQK